ncbi:FixJ family two-component response regulator [Bradyrhizobium sp. LB7.2]
MTRPDHSQPPGGSLNSVVIIVDDDAGIRASLDSLFRSVGLETRLFGSPAELLGGSLPDGPGCIVLDISAFPV